MAGGVGAEMERPRGAAAGEWGGICVLSKQQPHCLVAALLPHQSPQPNVLQFPPPQGDWGRARVPRGVSEPAGMGALWVALGFSGPLFSPFLEALGFLCHGMTPPGRTSWGHQLQITWWGKDAEGGPRQTSLLVLTGQASE